MLRYLLLLPVVISLVFAGCSNDKTNTRETLTLSLKSNGEGFEITDYRVVDKPFQKARQQGLYQAHLQDEKGNILRRVSFEKINVPAARKKEGEAEFYVSLPLVPNLDQITFYQLDGSSGHYQVKTDNPLLNWSLPKEIEQKDRE